MKSPLKDNPLHNPGQSLDKQIDDLINDKLSTYALVVAASGGLAVLEWLQWWFKMPPTPYLMTIIFLIVLLYSLPKMLKIKKHLRRLRQGRDGEKVVGQYLESLREFRAKVFHDIPAKGFNIDHVVIALSGIYVIETKTYSKPEQGRPTIIFNGKTIKINGLAENNKPIIQATSAAHWLQSLLQESTGKNFEVKPVVVFPGWFVEPTTEAKNSKVWVLNPKALPAFISKSNTCLNNDEIHMAAYHLSRYIRNF